MEEVDPLTSFRSESEPLVDGRLVSDPMADLLENIRLNHSSYDVVQLDDGEELTCAANPDFTGLFVIEGDIELRSGNGEVEMLRQADFVLVTPRQLMHVTAIGGGCLLGRVHYGMDMDRASLLLKMLPPHLTVRRGQAQDDEWEWQLRLSRLIVDRRHCYRASNAAIDRRLVEVVLIGVIQQYLTSMKTTPALTDPELVRIGPSLHAIHQFPAKAWTVTSLARVAGMSRTLFAVRFAEYTGQTPARYLLERRMELARDLLARSPLALAAVAHRCGYSTDVAFARAFRRRNGVSPGRYRTETRMKGDARGTA
ncbi:MULTISPECIES: AraC family transcriptional regulator [Sphingobium]|uniref:HTH araC/xylS-type domain-containing protein n=1 Tax=Sphingobium baderi TaxID=1332080 RepID=A0A0S3F1Z9_9SPHN|nr:MULTISPECIES: AraC family transcriptional regulator [Sphingobium]ALR21676.1 hypothetical protein ATN00_16605 [Sphingobium baderi]